MLPSNIHWILVDSFYRKLEEGNTCQNCSRNISHIAKIRNEKNPSEIYFVGMDCAETLTSHNPLQVDFHKHMFSEAEAMRKRILKTRKQFPEILITYTVIPDGPFSEIMIEFHGGRYGIKYWKSFSSENYQKYILPMISDLSVYERKKD
jgi:hypothetical protein